MELSLSFSSILERSLLDEQEKKKKKKKKKQKENATEPSLRGKMEQFFLSLYTYFSRNSMHEILSYHAPILTLGQTENTISLLKNLLN